jgi:uncharacterized protein YndB with AHSA1/START domain
MNGRQGDGLDARVLSTLTCLLKRLFLIGREYPMANPLTMLDLKADGFQMIQETHIEASPAKVWKKLIDFGAWFRLYAEPKDRPKDTFEAWPGGKWTTEHLNGTLEFNGVVTRIEPEKLLRLGGPLGMSHLPVQTVWIFELQAEKEGKATLLRVGQRTYGLIDAEAKQRYTGGWGRILPQLKKLVEESA